MKIVRALALCFALGAACNGSVDVGLEITLPGDLVSKTAWFEVGAYKDARCKDVITPMLSNGIPEGPTARVAFARKDAVGPQFGEIPNGKYAFAAVARDKECTVLATGCTEEDVADTKNVTIRMDAVQEPSGKCPVGASCQAAKCVPANDNADPSVGAGCSLELLGAGPLLHLANRAGLMSAPAIAPTSTGFVIAYRENDPSGGAARLILLAVDPAGGVYGTDKKDIKVENAPPLGNCARAKETDGIGLVVAGETGKIAVANSCEKPYFTLVNFDVTMVDEKRGTLSARAINFVKTDLVVPVTLGAAHASTARPAGDLTVYTENGVARIAQMSATDGIVGPNGDFGGTTGITDAWVTANEKVLALLAVGVGGLPASPVGDGGGGEGDPTGESELRLLMLPPDTPVNTIKAADNTGRAPITFPGKWGSIAALGGRVIVLTDGTGPGRSVTYRAFDFGRGEEATDTGGFPVEGTGDVTAGDVAVVGNRAYFAALKAGAIELHVFDNASTKLTRLRNVSFGRETRISAISTVGDGRVAVAATPTRVAVVWTTQKELDPDDPAGGYAVFACTQ
jgi:hypothetical protein